MRGLGLPKAARSHGRRADADAARHEGFLGIVRYRILVDGDVRPAERVLALGEREVASRVIGEMVMRELKKMDDVAYIRFASVYEDFQRVDDFRDAILEVKKPGTKRARRIEK